MLLQLLKESFEPAAAAAVRCRSWGCLQAALYLLLAARVWSLASMGSGPQCLAHGCQLLLLLLQQYLVDNVNSAALTEVLHFEEWPVLPF